MEHLLSTIPYGSVSYTHLFWYTGGATIFGGIPDSFLWLGQAKIGFIPVPTILMIAVVVFFWFIFSWTEFGRRLYAIGGNPVASRLSGVHVSRDKTHAFGPVSYTHLDVYKRQVESMELD